MQDGVDLDQRAARQPGDADRGARRERLAYVLRHDFVDARKVRKIRQVDRHAHGLVEARAGCGGDGCEVAEHPVGLAVDALGQLQGRRVETDLARQVHGVVRAHRLRIAADRLGRVARLDRGLHGGYLSLMIPAMKTDRKSTRLNSTHITISYSGICAKKKITSPSTPSINSSLRTYVQKN